MRVQRSPPMFLGWQISEVFAILPDRRPELFLQIPAWWSEGCEPSRASADPTPPFFLYKPSFLMNFPFESYMGNISIAAHCALTYCAFLDSFCFGDLLAFAMTRACSQ